MITWTLAPPKPRHTFNLKPFGRFHFPREIFLPTLPTPTFFQVIKLLVLGWAIWLILLENSPAVWDHPSETSLCLNIGYCVITVHTYFAILCHNTYTLIQPTNSTSRPIQLIIWKGTPADDVVQTQLPMQSWGWMGPQPRRHRRRRIFWRPARCPAGGRGIPRGEKMCQTCRTTFVSKRSWKKHWYKYTTLKVFDVFLIKSFV